MLAGYIFGGNEKQETMEMTTPVFMREGKMQFVLSDKTYNNEVGPAWYCSPRHKIQRI